MGQNESSTAGKQTAKVTYFHEMTITKFPTGIKKGKYAFPLVLYLPKQMPSTLEVIVRNCGVYTICEEPSQIQFQLLASFNSLRQDQSFRIVRQPIQVRQRLKIESPISTSTELSKNARLCCCWKDNQKVEINFEFNSSYWTIGEKNKMSLKIKNLDTDEINKVTLNLYEQITLDFVTSPIARKLSHICEIQQFNRSIQPGKQQSLLIQTTLEEVENDKYTSIGQMIQRIYFLEAKVYFSCCTYASVKTDIILEQDIYREGQQKKFDLTEQEKGQYVRLSVNHIKDIRPYFYQFTRQMKQKFPNSHAAFNEMKKLDKLPPINNTQNRLMVEEDD